MEESSREFLSSLLAAAGPAGHEVRAARIWRARAEEFGAKVRVDAAGNSLATVHRRGSGRPKVMLAGHIDEIGLIVTSIDEKGYASVEGLGSWDPTVLAGQRVSILTRHGDVRGVIGRKPAHLMTADELSKAPRLQDLWIDIGARDRADAQNAIRVGDPVVIDASVVELRGGRIASRALDNRAGAFVVIEALRLLATDPAPLAEVTAVATTGEEAGFVGAAAGAFGIEPDVAIAVDVTFSNDDPGGEPKVSGEHPLGSGAAIGRWAGANLALTDLLIRSAEEEGIPYTIEAMGKRSGTDADAILRVRAGIPSALVSVPLRYMHTPVEVASLDDLTACARLLAAACRRLGPDTELRPL